MNPARQIALFACTSLYPPVLFRPQLGAVDATQAQSLAQKYGVQGYPTIKTFPAGVKKSPQDYNGPREAAGIVDYATGVREGFFCSSWRSVCSAKGKGVSFFCCWGR